MKILHLAAANRWTGAAAPAFAEVEALRGAGVDAHYAYVGGYKLEEKLAHFDFAHPLILKSQNPVAFWRSVQNLAHAGGRHGFDLVHAHLTYDHWLARFLVRERPMPIARTFHSRRALRSDPFARSLLSRTAATFVVNDALARAGALEGRTVTVTPPPLDQRLFSPHGDNVRSKYQLDAETPLIAVIGKIAPGRGFDDALRTFAHVRRTIANTRMMVIGHGPHRTALESQARGLGIDFAIVWAGYHEDDLPRHYRAADALLFTASGSDEGHRAVIEAMGCGVPPATYPIEGMASLLGPLAGRLIAAAPTPEALATRVGEMLAAGRELKNAVAAHATMFSFHASAQRHIEVYSRVMQRTFL